MMAIRQWLLAARWCWDHRAPAAWPIHPAGEAVRDLYPRRRYPPKDSYLIGMSQANKGEPWRQAMNDQIAAAAAASRTGGGLRRRRPEQRQAGRRRRELPPAGDRPADHLAERGGAADRRRRQSLCRGRAGDRARPQGQRRSVHDVDRRRQRGDRPPSRQYAANYCEEQSLDPCNIIEIRGLEGSTPAKERGDGFREGIADNPSATIIAQQNADWLREKAIPVSQAMFQANPDVNVVYTHNDPMTEAAIISAQNAGLNLDDILFIGIDALPTPDGGIRSVIDGRIDVTYVYPTGGAERSITRFRFSSKVRRHQLRSSWRPKRSLPRTPRSCSISTRAAVQRRHPRLAARLSSFVPSTRFAAGRMRWDQNVTIHTAGCFESIRHSSHWRPLSTSTKSALAPDVTP